MANLEVLALDTAVPQIRAPGVGDGYTFPRDVTLATGTANGVLYLNASKVATSGSAVTYNGTTFTTTGAANFATSSGNVVVGATSVSGWPNGKLLVKQSNAGVDGGFSVTSSSNANTTYVSHTGTLAAIGADYGSGGSYTPLTFLTGGSERMRLDSSGNLGIGTTSPAGKLDSLGTSYFGADSNVSVYLLSSSTEARVGVGGRSSVTNVPLTFWTADGGSNSEKMRLDPSGNLGLGVTPSAWGSGYKAYQVGNASLMGYAGASESYVNTNAFYDNTGWKYISTAAASRYSQGSGAHSWSTAASGTAGNAITFTQAMTLDASGNLLVGTTTTSSLAGAGRGLIEVNGSSDSAFAMKANNTLYGYLYNSASEFRVANVTSNPITFFTNNTERARITAAGEFLVAKTSDVVTTVGTIITSDGRVLATTNDADCLVCNRQVSDGTLVEFRHANVTEGTISVSGNTVSYNAFAGSHWSQLQDGSKPEIPRGTVMESINELCVWPGENNERLPKAKISDTVGSKKVYGVFMAWDNDWTTTNDMYVTAVGAFICRVNSSVTVQEGDLLESNGDGTARVQADDIIRSSTIGKVTSTVKTHEYDDGSYCVPTVLYCG